MVASSSDQQCSEIRGRQAEKGGCHSLKDPHEIDLDLTWQQSRGGYHYPHSGDDGTEAEFTPVLPSSLWPSLLDWAPGSRVCLPYHPSDFSLGEITLSQLPSQSIDQGTEQKNPPNGCGLMEIFLYGPE